MPDSKIVWLPRALQRLDHLRDFLRKQSPEAAVKATRAILQTTQLLSRNPEAGSPVYVGDDDDPELTWFRDLIVPFGKNNYVLRYRIDENAVEQHTVVIVQVWHSREDRP